MSVFGKHIPVGVRLNVVADVVAGVNDHRGVELDASCELEIPFNGMVGVIPVTGAGFGDMHASVGAGAGFTAQFSAHVNAAVSTVGEPPVLWVPSVSFTNPTAHVSAAAEVAVSAGFGAGVKFGLGNAYVTDATLNFDNALDFTAQASTPDGVDCNFQAKFASFSAEGKIAGWTVSSPSTPPLFTKTLKAWPNCEPTNHTTTTTTTTASTTTSTTSGTTQYDHVTALGPTSGPSTFSLEVGVPTCPGTLVFSYGRWAGGGGILNNEAWVTVNGPAGTYDALFECRASGTNEVLWSGEHLTLTVTGPAPPVELQSATVARGGTLTFLSGPSAGVSPCPAFGGLPVRAVYFNLRGSPTLVVGTPVVWPDGGRSTYALSVPADFPTGTATASELCDYGSAYLNYAEQPVTVTP